MHRRSFLARCSLAAAGATLSTRLFPVVGSAQAARLSTGPVTVPLTDSDRALLQLLSAYSSNVSLCGGGVFTRATGTVPQNGATQLLASVTDYSLLVAFLRSDAEKSLGTVYASSNTLSFSFEGTAYVVTNRDANAAVAAASAASLPPPTTEAAAAPFTHEALAYHPATNTLSDPYAVLKKHRIDLAETPTGGLKARFQTLVHGWLESAQYGLKLGKNFQTFQTDLLASQPTAKAAKKVVQALLENISALAASFDVDALRPLLTSPLVSASLQSVLGLNADEVLAAVEKLRTELASGDYTDAALWLATLLGSQLQDGTASEWLDLLSGDNAASSATLAALKHARRLVTGADRGTL